jgi:hypothetical protein
MSLWSTGKKIKQVTSVEKTAQVATHAFGEHCSVQAQAAKGLPIP